MAVLFESDGRMSPERDFFLSGAAMGDRGVMGETGEEACTSTRYEAREPWASVTSFSQSDFPVDITT